MVKVQGHCHMIHLGSIRHDLDNWQKEPIVSNGKTRPSSKRVHNWGSNQVCIEEDITSKQTTVVSPKMEKEERIQASCRVQLELAKNDKRRVVGFLDRVVGFFR